jgi:hypothetical protein
MAMMARPNNGDIKMKTFTQEQLIEIISNHKKWRLGEDGGFRANLYDVDLRGANLYGADLRGANLRDAAGNMNQLKSMQVNNWPVSYTADRLQIGCQNHSIEEWKNFDDEQIQSMTGGALEWWKTWKPVIFNIIEISPANPTKTE